MTPARAVALALTHWNEDHVEIEAVHKERIRLRVESMRSAVLRSAALSLCAERGHGRELRGCEQCRNDVAAVWPELRP